MGFSRELAWFRHLHWTSGSSKVQRSDLYEDFESFDAMERGMCRGFSFAQDLIQACPANCSRRKLRVERSDDRKRFVLFDENSNPLMDARTNLDTGCVQIYSGLSDEKAPSSFPAFVLDVDVQKTNWRLTCSCCEHCIYRAPHRSCKELGGQTMAFMSHMKEDVGAGVAMCMDVSIPQVNEDNSNVVWCPIIGASAYDSRVEMSTLRPRWDKKAQSLVMDFKGRVEVASAKNFQLCLDDHAVLVYGKLRGGDFCLDFEHPLSPAQAFAIALTTQFWT